jgi:hypothetical protein
MLNGISSGSGMVGQGAKRKSKFVPLYSQQGKEQLVIKLPGMLTTKCLDINIYSLRFCSVVVFCWLALCVGFFLLFVVFCNYSSFCTIIK